MQLSIHSDNPSLFIYPYDSVTWHYAHYFILNPADFPSFVRMSERDMIFFNTHLAYRVFDFLLIPRETSLKVYWLHLQNDIGGNELHRLGVGLFFGISLIWF